MYPLVVVVTMSLVRQGAESNNLVYLVCSAELTSRPDQGHRQHTQELGAPKSERLLARRGQCSGGKGLNRPRHSAPANAG